MYDKFKLHLEKEINGIVDAGLYKEERIITSPQGAEIKLSTGQSVLNFCANNYLGLSDNDLLKEAVIRTLDSHGYGMSSVRFICGTTDIHKTLENTISRFFGTEDTLLYAACFDANGGLFAPLFTEDDAIISDWLNHASIIDGVQLCKAKRYRYSNADMNDLEDRLIEASAQRFRIIVTDGVFSMNGNTAPLDEIHRLAEKYNAMVAVDESHSAGVVGKTGRGVTELFDLRGEIEIITGTLGKAFGGGTGGFTTGKKEIISMLRQRSRPYLFSNSIPPSSASAAVKAFKILDTSSELINRLHDNTEYFSAAIIKAGFDIKPSKSAICAVMLYDAILAQRFSSRLLELGIYAIGFFYPVVPQGQARIRVQLSAAHTKDHLDKAIEAFEIAGRELGVIK